MNISENRVKSLLALIGVLLISNLFLAYLLWKGCTPAKKDHGLALYNYMKDELHLSANQVVLLDSARNQHRNDIKTKFDALRTQKRDAFKMVGAAGFSDSAIANAAIFAGSQQKELETAMLLHLKDIRNICTPEQKAKFDTGFYKIFNKQKK